MTLKTKTIIGVPNLASYLNVSRQTVYKYLENGMPGNKINETWHFHQENIEEWFKVKTRAIRKDLLDEIQKKAASAED